MGTGTFAELTDRQREAIESLELHDHACLLYRSTDEELAAGVLFAQTGLNQEQRCVYRADNHMLEDVRWALKQAGVDVETAEAGKRLRLRSRRTGSEPDQSGTTGDPLDPAAAIQAFSDWAAESKQLGFRGFRTVNEQSWLLDGDQDLDWYYTFESLMNQFFATHDGLAMCQYNMNLLSADVILAVLAVHPKAMINGIVCRNFYYRPPEEFFQPHETWLTVERMLKNLYDFELSEIELARSHRALQEANATLERRVAERTAELEQKAQELRDLNRNLVGREYRIRELKQQVEWLQRQVKSRD